MASGWIKLHRKIQKKGYYKNSKYVHLWIHLLLNANHKEKEFMWNEKIIVIKEGQLLSGRRQLSVDTGISESSIERILKMLENEHQIEQQKTTKYRLITIVNWKSHQIDEQQNGQQTDNKRTTDGQQADTNKNDKNDKNGEKEPAEDDNNKKTDILNYFTAKSYPISEAEEFFNHYESQGWVTGNGIPIKNWRVKAENWHREQMRRAADKPKTEYKQKIENSTYKQAFVKKMDECENGCGKKGTIRFGERKILVCSKKCGEEFEEKNKNAFKEIGELVAGMKV